MFCHIIRSLYSSTQPSWNFTWVALTPKLCIILSSDITKIKRRTTSLFCVLLFFVFWLRRGSPKHACLPLSLGGTIERARENYSQINRKLIRNGSLLSVCTKEHNFHRYCVAQYCGHSNGRGRHLPRTTGKGWFCRVAGGNTTRCKIKLMYKIFETPNANL